MAACYQGSPPDVGLRQRKGIYSKKGTCCNAKKYSIALCMLYYSLSTSSLIWSSYQANATIVLVLQIESTWVNRPAFGCRPAFSCRPDLRSSQKHSFFKHFCFVFRWKITKKHIKSTKRLKQQKKYFDKLSGARSRSKYTTQDVDNFFWTTFGPGVLVGNHCFIIWQQFCERGSSKVLVVQIQKGESWIR